jgi:hypothetical protein
MNKVIKNIMTHLDLFINLVVLKQKKILQSFTI